VSLPFESQQYAAGSSPRSTEDSIVTPSGRDEIVGTHCNPTPWHRLTPLQTRGSPSPASSAPNFSEKHPHDVSVEPINPPAYKPSGIFARIWWRFRRAYNTSLVPTVLPSPPHDDEKYAYCKLNRLTLIGFDLIAALSIGASTWLFTKSGPAFYWYGVYAAVIFIFLYPSFFILGFKKGFPLDAHKKSIIDYPIDDETAPTVDIFLPVCCEESEVLENTWTYIQKLNYPAHKLKVYVLDDGAEERVALRAQRFGFNYIVRPDRPHLKKAGNIRYAFTQTQGDYYAIFDADFCPRPDFLLETIPVCLNDDKVAIVQTPQYFRSLKEQSWVEQAAGPHQEYFYRLVQTMRGSWGATVCCGSNAVYRRTALAEVGGCSEVESSEDMYTGVQMIDHGYKVVYVPIVLACGVCPSTVRSYFSQQARWCSGSVTLLTNRAFWSAKLSFVQKACFGLGFMYYLTASLGVFLNPIPAPLLLWLTPNNLIYYNMFFGVPGMIHSLIVIPLWTKSRYPPFKVQYVNTIVAFACISTFIGCMFKKGEGKWVSSGSNKNSKNTRYRNMRILAWVITILHEGNLIAAVTYRLLKGFPWYNVLPMLILDAFWLFCSHRFLFAS